MTSYICYSLRDLDIGLISLNAVVTSTFGIPTGAITVTASGSLENCTGNLLDGVGTCDLTLYNTGSYTLTATFNGDGIHSNSSDIESHTVIMEVFIPLVIK